MASDDRFKQSIVTMLAKRAANRCSNPSCSAITSGPAAMPLRSVNVGEAAHIYGANPGSARYDPSMSSIDRSGISNAIWLCGNCHKLVDDDPNRYPSGLLFEWQREHESRMAELIGKADFEARKKYQTRHLEEFGRLSYLAERLILEKDDFWEYRLTAEVLRFEMKPVLQRWEALRKGLYIRSISRLSQEELLLWISSRLREATSMAHAFTTLVNEEFSKAWGEPGVPGNDAEIVTTSRLLAEMCQSALDWEEAVRFVTADEDFEDLFSLLRGTGGRMIEEAKKLPDFLSQIFATEHPSGSHELNLVIALAEGWEEKVEAALRRATSKLLGRV